MINEFEQAQQMYDKHAQKFLKERYKHSREVRERIKSVYKPLSPVENKKILNIGCGDGSECVLFAENGAEVVGIDCSNELIKTAKSKYSELGIEFFVMDYEQTSFADNTFDGIVSVMSIMYKENLNKVLLELKRILKPEGTMVILVPHPVQKMIKYSNFDYFASGLHYETHEGVERFNYYRTIEEYYQEFRQAGFIVNQLLEPKPVFEKPPEVVIVHVSELFPHELIFVLNN